MKRHMLLTMLLLMSVALMTSNTYATTANQSSSDNITTSNNISHLNIENQKSELIQNTTTSGLKPLVTVNDTGKNQIKSVHSYFNDTINSLYYNQNDSNTIQYAIAAAGDESSSNVHITTQQIVEAAGKVKTFIEDNHKLPNFVQIENTPVNMPQFLQLLTTGLIQINNNNINTITLKSADKPTKPTENVQNGNIPKKEYLELANKIKSFMETGKAPNFATSTLGKIRYESLIYTYSRIMDYYNTKNKLPNYVTIEPWETTETTTNTNPTNNVIYLTQIHEAAGKVKTFIEDNHKLPNFVQIENTPVNMPQFLQLLTTGLIQINNNNINTITLKSADKPTKPTENVRNGNIPKKEYLELANKIKSFMETGKAPNFATSTLGKIRYESLIYTYSRIMDYYNTKNKLPNYVTIEPWETTDTSVTDDLDKYLQNTTNCQSTNSAIITLANSLTINKTTTYAKAVAIFNWVSDNISYSFYYNSVKGALSTLNSKNANCCDTTHLLIALMRASGIPARYLHGTCTFSDGTFGHVFAQVYVGDTWYYADAISNKNTFGSINNWNLNTYTLNGIYSSLPF